MIRFSALLFAYSGFTALSLAMNRHFQQLWQRVPQRHEQLVLRAVGSALLIASLLSVTATSGVAFGLVAWVGVLTVALLVVSCVLAYWPAAARMMACVALLAALLR